jgi:hypothetical protein
MPLNGSSSLPCRKPMAQDSSRNPLARFSQNGASLASAWRHLAFLRSLFRACEIQTMPSPSAAGTSKGLSPVSRITPGENSWTLRQPTCRALPPNAPPHVRSALAFARGSVSPTSLVPHSFCGLPVDGSSRHPTAVPKTSRRFRCPATVFGCLLRGRISEIEIEINVHFLLRPRSRCSKKLALANDTPGNLIVARFRGCATVRFGLRDGSQTGEALIFCFSFMPLTPQKFPLGNGLSIFLSWERGTGIKRLAARCVKTTSSSVRRIATGPRSNVTHCQTAVRFVMAARIDCLAEAASRPQRQLDAVAYSHMDTQWRWTVHDTIFADIPATLREPPGATLITLPDGPSLRHFSAALASVDNSA